MYVYERIVYSYLIYVWQLLFNYIKAKLLDTVAHMHTVYVDYEVLSHTYLLICIPLQNCETSQVFLRQNNLLIFLICLKRCHRTNNSLREHP